MDQVLVVEVTLDAYFSEPFCFLLSSPVPVFQLWQIKFFVADLLQSEKHAS